MGYTNYAAPGQAPPTRGVVPFPEEDPPMSWFTRKQFPVYLHGYRYASPMLKGFLASNPWVLPMRTLFTPSFLTEKDGKEHLDTARLVRFLKKQQPLAPIKKHKRLTCIDWEKGCIDVIKQSFILAPRTSELYVDMARLMATTRLNSPEKDVLAYYSFYNIPYHAHWASERNSFWRLKNMWAWEKLRGLATCMQPALWLNYKGWSGEEGYAITENMQLASQLASPTNTPIIPWIRMRAESEEGVEQYVADETLLSYFDSVLYTKPNGLCIWWVEGADTDAYSIQFLQLLKSELRRRKLI